MSNLGGRQEQPHSLVICEKPAALRKAHPLGTGSPKILQLDLQHGQKTKKGFQTPVFHATDVNELSDMFINRTFVRTGRSQE
jgi:hypothetical protein